MCVFLQLISRKDKATFEKLDYLTSKEENYARMREYIRSLKMVPCIPYLGESSYASVFKSSLKNYFILNVNTAVSSLQMTIHIFVLDLSVDIRPSWLAGFSRCLFGHAGLVLLFLKLFPSRQY